jgi:hypothetical protein
MRNLLALAALGLLAFAGLGWYFGWYKIETSATPTGRNISIDVDGSKIRDDVSRGKDKLRDLLDDDNNNPAPTKQPNVQPVPQGDIQPAGFQRPAENGSFAPVPPSGAAPKLPPPR